MKTPQTKTQTAALLAVLVASLFFAVNCAKPSNGKRAGVTAQTTANKNQPGGQNNGQPGTQQDAKQTEQQEIAQAKECSDSLKKTYSEEVALYTDILAKKSNAILNNTEANKDSQTAKMQNYLKKCDEFKTLFKQQSNNDQLCKMTPATQDRATLLIRWEGSREQNPVSLRCLYISEQLKALTGTDNAFTSEAEKQKNEVEAEGLKKQTFSVSEELKAMTKEEALHFNSFVFDGEIKTDATVLKDALNKKKVVCSFTTTGEELEAKTKTTFKFLQYAEADTTNLPVGVNGKSVIFASTLEKDGGEKNPGPMMTITCVHMPKDNITMGTILKTFGKHLKVENKTIEVTMVSSADPSAASKPAEATTKPETAKPEPAQPAAQPTPSKEPVQEKPKAQPAQPQQKEKTTPEEQSSSGTTKTTQQEQSKQSAQSEQAEQSAPKVEGTKGDQLSVDEFRRTEIEQRNKDAAEAKAQAKQAKESAAARAQKAKEDFRRSEIEAMNAAAKAEQSKEAEQTQKTDSSVKDSDSSEPYVDPNYTAG